MWGGDQAGIRWYELRKSGGSWSIYQQGTYAPDSHHRWMGSIAMDGGGNMALGYSISSSTINPSIRYVGRLASDSLGTMPQGETQLVAGSQPQTHSYRWGDYSNMSVDPVDDCTFWYTQEYVTNSAARWRTRVGSFKFPSCIPTQEKILNLVTEYYNDVLDRAPEPGGAEWWTAEIQRVVSLGIDVKEGFIALGKFFFNSDEYLLKNTTDDEYVIDLYETFLDRTPLQSEVDYWADFLTQGLSRGILLNYFAYSTEFMLYMEGIFGVGSTRSENNLVNDFYRGLLNRLPDTGGFNSYLNMMRTAQCTGAQAVRDLSHQIALGFIQSAEYALRSRDNSEYVEDLYNGILRRGAELGGFNYWVGVLDSETYTREEVLEFFTASVEFQLRVQEVIDAGCI